MYFRVVYSGTFKYFPSASDELRRYINRLIIIIIIIIIIIVIIIIFLPEVSRIPQDLEKLL